MERIYCCPGGLVDLTCVSMGGWCWQEYEERTERYPNLLEPHRVKALMVSGSCMLVWLDVDRCGEEVISGLCMDRCVDLKWAVER